VTAGGVPVGVPLPIGGTSAILGTSMTGPYPHSLVKRRGEGRKRLPESRPVPASAQWPVAVGKGSWKKEPAVLPVALARRRGTANGFLGRRSRRGARSQAGTQPEPRPQAEIFPLRL
jgi:hypothetical protein